MAQIHFTLDERLLDQSAGGLFSRVGAYFRLFAIQEGRDPDLLVDLGLGDYLVTRGDCDAVDDLGGKRPEANGQQQAGDAKHVHQNACPSEKWNWKTLMRWFVRGTSEPDTPQ